MKSKILKGMLGVLLVVSLLLVAIPGTVGAVSGVVVNITECPTCPVTPCTDFGIKAEITNWGPGATAGDVTVTCNAGGNATVLAPESINIGVLDDGEMNTVAFMVHCDDPGSASITVTTNKGGSDGCTVDQRDPPALVAGIVCPCEVCTNCGPEEPDDEFEINAWVQNTGDVAASNVRLTISRAPTDGAHIVGSTEKWIGDVPANSGQIYITTKWEAECDKEGPVVFTVTPAGENACTHDAIDGSLLTVDTCTVEQEDVLVDITCVLGLDSEGNPACGETCPQEFDTMSTDPGGDHDQQFIVTANIKNCTGFSKDLDIQLVKPSCATLVGDTAHVYCPGVPYEADLPVTTPDWTVDFTGLCGCCEVEVTWLLECTCTNCPEDLVVNVTETSPGSGTWDNSKCDTAQFAQVEKAHLVTTMTPLVGDCCCNPFTDPVTAVAVDQEFDVEICIENTGDALADNVEVDLNVEGDTDCTGPCNNIVFPDIPGGQTRCVLLSDWAKGPCLCTDTGQVMISVTDIRGDDANTCEEIPGANIDPVCPLLINQCDVDIELMNPPPPETVCVGDAFAVKAKLTNCGPCDLRDVDFTLRWDGPGSIALASEEPGWTKTIAEILAPLPECPLPCTEYEVTWNVECTGAGDVNLWVCAESETVGDPLPLWPELTVKTPKVTVEQIPPPVVMIDIISPDPLQTYAATSQEFAVTANITNDGTGDDITVTDLVLNLLPEDGAHVVDGPQTGFTIANNETETVTWTVHCDEEGLLTVYATVTAVTEPCCPSDTADSTPVAIWQYPAAHLVVDIDRVEPDTTINVCENFTVYYTVENTGQADATEVEAVLSVTPEGSARPVAGPGGYTQYIGTIPRDGETEELSWELHCKEACESTIKIAVNGYDEYGWHQKQQCQSTGAFEITEGTIQKIPWCDPYSGVEELDFTLVGTPSGLTGPFNLEADMTFEFGATSTCCSGILSATGVIYPEDHDPPAMPGAFDGVGIITNMAPCGYGDPPQAPEQCSAGGTMTVEDGLFHVENGLFEGWLHGTMFAQPLDIAITNGLFCSTMASTPLMEIPDKFIEDASITVKQLPPSADLEIEKVADYCEAFIGDVVTYTITLANNGPSDTTNVVVADTLPAGVSYVGCAPDQGWYDPTSGIWDVGDVDVATGDVVLEIDVVINSAGKHYNRATIIAADQHDPVTGNNSDMVLVTGVSVEIDTVALLTGQNLISLPKIPDDPDIADMLMGLPVTAVAYWTGGPEGVGEWWYYYPGDPGGSTLEFDELNDGKGYWVNLSAPGGPIDYFG